MPDKCNKCIGICCKASIMLTQRDIDTMKKGGIDTSFLKPFFKRPNFVGKIPRVNGFCKFYQGKQPHCTIYDQRPWICRKFSEQKCTIMVSQ